jgi:hypothetical protein
MRSTDLPILAAWIFCTTAALAEQPAKEQVMRSATGEATAQPSKERVVLGSMPGIMPAPGDSACSLCYTCGGSWPVFGGAIPTRIGAQPWERGAACAGNLAPAADAAPYLCCR